MCGAFRHPERRKTSYVKETLIQSQSQCFPKRRGILIALRAVVISSVAERSFLHCGQYHIGTAGKQRLGATHILCLSVCMEDFSLTLEMTMRESSSHQSQVPSYSSLLSNFWGSHFSYRHPERSRGIFLALRSVSHRHCRKATPWCYTHPLFIGLHGRFLAYARNDDTGV